jgi:ferredoxin
MDRNLLIHPSTRAFYNEARKSRGFSFFNFIHGYIYARWVYFYIAMGTGQHPLARRLEPAMGWIGNLITQNAPADGSIPMIKMEDTYHGKVVPLQAARELVSVKEDIDLGDMEKIIPYSLARDIVFQNPDHIVVMDCPCRSARENPCKPMDVCIVIGEPFAGFVLAHNPDRSRQITSEEAQAIIKAEDDRGHVHHAFFKDAMMGRFYAICNCCSCCCAAVNAHRNGTPMLASSGYVAVIDRDKCRSCGVCEKACLFAAITKNGTMNVDPSICMGCGICANQCRFDAIHMVRDQARGEPLEIRELIRNFHG